MDWKSLPLLLHEASRHSCQAQGARARPPKKAEDGIRVPTALATGPGIRERISPYHNGRRTNERADRHACELKRRQKKNNNTVMQSSTQSQWTRDGDRPGVGSVSAKGRASREALLAIIQWKPCTAKRAAGVGMWLPGPVQ